MEFIKLQAVVHQEKLLQQPVQAISCKCKVPAGFALLSPSRRNLSPRIGGSRWDHSVSAPVISRAAFIS